MRLREEPVAFWATLDLVLKTGAAMLILFGVLTWTPEQTAGVLIFFAALGGVFAFIVRGKVTSSANPKDDAGNPLTPGTIGNDEADLPPI